ncbi:MAG TPA: DNA-3-methyladenine glycosylase 2 family protein [Candidatus Dormibacteraeota bacterium]
MDKVAARIVKIDPAFRPIVEAIGPLAIRPPSDDAFQALLRTIVFQQLAGKAASAILGRVLGLFDGSPTPAALLALDEAKLRAAGMSANKTLAVIDLARKFTDGTVPSDDLDSLGDDEVITRLSQIRGIGRWSAEMFLIFQLRRPDIWPADDLGVRNGWRTIHQLAVAPTPKELAALGDPFRPQRSAVAWYCWRAVAPVAVA